MTTILRAIAAFIVALGTAFGIVTPAIAQQTTCSVVGTSSPIQATYDPFSPTGLATTEITMLLTRQNAVGGGDPRIVNMYLTGPAAVNGTQIEVVSVTPVSNGGVNAEGIGLDIFYDTGEAKPLVLPIGNTPSAGNRFLKINFTGNNADSDRANVTLRVTLPANADLSAGGLISFDGNYGCFIRGGQGNGIESQSFFPNAVNLQITVLSALQATYAGTALDFGEIGDVTTADVNNAPLAHVTPPINYVRVQSSGPYEIALTSGNNYVLTPGGAATADPLQRVGYRLKFLGQTRSTGNPAPIGFVCPRAGVGAAVEDRLYLQAQLAEGGVGKLPSPAYRDTLTVTISPRAASVAPNIGECAALSGQF